MIGAKIGQLTVKGKLGEGGMGAVYYAEHELLHLRRVVKVLLPQWTQSELLVQRFINEARAAAAIRHRHIIQVHDCGQLADGTWYIVMDYLEGQTLGRFGGAHGGPISPHVTLQILAPTAAGLEAAHRAGIVHRDLKPDNIFLTQHAQNPHSPVIIDFGIAKLGEREGGAVTRTGMIAGTPAYMAPEQMRDLKLVDARSDVYALGVITYQMLTGGYLPYQEESTLDDFNQLSAAEIYHRQMSRPPIDPRERGAGIPERCAAAVRAAIDPDPARRLPSPRAFVLKLAEAIEGDGFRASGTDIVRAYASELLEIGNLLETVRGPKPASGTTTPARSRYLLGDRLGAGGMAEVFRGTMIGAEGIELPVAVKRVLPGLGTPQSSRCSSRRRSLPHCSSTRTSSTCSTSIAIRKVACSSSWSTWRAAILAKLVETGLLPFSSVNFILSEILSGLGYAHELPTSGPVRGLVHRDISPHNVLLSWEGAVKVSDFGIAKARETSAATASTLVKGKVAYMSPEQANSEALDGRSDLFAVGVMAWELLTGSRLFGNGTARETLARVLFAPIPSPRTVRPEIPADLEAVTMRLLERDKAARYARAELVMDDLASCVDAPRSGRGRLDLARLLAARFPEAVAVRSSTPRPGVGTPSADATPHPQIQVTVRGDGHNMPPVGTPASSWQPSKTTLGTAASQSVHGARRGARWPWLVASGLVLLGAAAGTFALALTKRDDRSEPSPRTATAPPEAAGSNEPQEPRGMNAGQSTLTVITEPPGRAIRIDGASRGKAPLTISAAPGSQVAIEAELDGFEPTKQTLEVAHETRTVTVSMKTRPAMTRSAVTIQPPAPARPSRDPRASTRAQPASPPTPGAKPPGTKAPDARINERVIDPEDVYVEE